ncbi:hypothetical protein BJY04DRAFT_222428 [Aspergillus karnatakaensis]|uniref:Zn(II)2Cys6 transcription factor domain-containing protein n=1 Tax=Aspergillus karnatakaensis TaxID=1810916 RepID=UPI003CCCB5F5
MPVRQSCDRCHGLKLRCIRGNGQASCHRCQTAEAACKYSQSMRGVRPKRPQKSLGGRHPMCTTPDNSLSVGHSRSASNQPSQLQPSLPPDIHGSQQYLDPGAIALNMFDYTIDLEEPFDFDFGSPVDMVHNALSPSQLIHPSQEDSTVFALEQRIHKLSEQTCEYLARLPPMQGGGFNRNCTAGNGNAEVMEPEIDTIFSLAEAAADVTKQFVNGLRQSRLHPGVTPPLGLASLYGLLSCQTRVLDIWTVLFFHMHGCFKSNLAKSTFTDNIVVRVASIRIGSFVPSIATALSMQLSLIVRSTAGLQDAARALVQEIELPCATPNPLTTEGFAAGLCDQVRGPTAASGCRNLLERASATVNTARHVKGLIEQVVKGVEGNLVAA